MSGPLGRRLGGGASFDPLSLEPRHWLVAMDSANVLNLADGEATDSDAISDLLDLSGNNFTVSNADALGGPTFDRFLINGKPGIKFGGTRQMNHSCTLGGGDFTLVCVGKFYNGASYDGYYSTNGPSSANEVSAFLRGPNDKWFAFNSTEALSDVTTGELKTLVMRRTGVSGQYFINGVADGVFGSGVVGQAGNLAGIASQEATMDFAMLGLFNRALTDEELSTLYAWINQQTAWASLPAARTTATRVAAFGDSITQGASAGLTFSGADCYWAWARVYGDSAWDIIPNGSILPFATGGKRTDDLIKLHLDDLLASDAQVVLVGGGTNDVVQGQTADWSARHRVGVCDELRKRGKTAILLSVPPIPLGYSGGSFSAAVVATNTATAALAAARGHAFVDVTTTLESTAGTGTGNASYFLSSSDLHPNTLGASRMGRAIHAALDGVMDFTLDPNANTDFLLANSTFALGSGPPTGWSQTPPASGTTAAQSMVVDGSYRLWRISMTKGASTGSWQLTNVTANTESPAGKTVEVVARLRVVSGTIIPSLTLAASPTPSQAAIDLYANAAGTISSTDGWVTLRTAPYTCGGSDTQAWPMLQVVPTGDAVIEVQLLTVREVA